MMEDITTTELRERLQKGEKLFIVDVREGWEFEEANLEGILIPLGELPARFLELESHKDQEIIIHCKSGGRSGRARDFLQTKGFVKVRNLLGGITQYLAEEQN